EQKADEKLGDTVPPPDSGRPRRAPPTIDLDASEITSETRAVEADPAPEYAAAPEPAAAEHASGTPGPENPQAATPPISPSPISPWVVAPISGAVAAALVIGVGWMLGWPPVQRAEAPQANTATIDALAGRVGGLEARLAKPAEDPAETARIAALEKSVASLREQSEKLAAQVDSVKSASPAEAPAEGAAPAVDLSAITQRLNALESASHSEGEPAKSDDLPLRRVLAASLLDLSVRQGDP